MKLSALELSLASLLVLGAAGLSLLLRLGLTRSLLVSSTRMVVQLLLVGEVLRVLFTLDSLPATLGLVAVMALIATWEAGSRQTRRFGDRSEFLVGGAAIGLSTAVVAMVGVRVMISADGWTQARYLVPLAGIILGTALNATTLALHHLLEALHREARTLETRLALGATTREAFLPLVQGAMRAAMLPTLNQMAAAGVVTLPGTMTGQMLAGLEASAAARSQVMLMFLLGAAAFLAALVGVQLTLWRLTDARARLRLERLRPARR